MEEEGIVIERHGNIAKVEIKRKEGCGGCRLCNLSESGRRIAEAEDLIGAKKGQEVIIEVSSTELLKGAFIIYLLPIFLFIVGLIIGREMASPLEPYWMKDVFSGLIGMIFLLFTFFLIYRYNKRVKGKFRPRIIRLKE